MSSLLVDLGELVQAETFLLEASRLAQRRGYVAGMRLTEGNMIELDLTIGRWDAAERRAHEFLAASEHEGHYLDNIAFRSLTMIELGRDQTDLALRDADRAITAARRVRDPQVLIPALSTGAFVHAELGDRERAGALLNELEPGHNIGSAPTAFFAAARLELAEEFRSSTRELRRASRWDRAGDAVLDGRWADAAGAYDEIGASPFAALAALRAAETYAAQGRRIQAHEQLARALQFWRSVGAKRYIREGEALLARSA